MSETSSQFKGIIIGLMIVSGAINTIAYKFQNRQLVYQGASYKYFFHPYMQATTMFFGQFLSLIVFFIVTKRDPEGYKMRMMQAKSKGKQIKMNKFLLAIPAFCDFITSTLQYISLNFIPGSVYQMMRGGTIVTTFLLSIVFLKTKVKKCQIAGSVLALVGVTIVGASNMIFSSSGSGSTDSSLQIIGYILILCSLLFNGFFFVFQQKLLNKYHLEPLQIVGYEGLFGLTIYIFLLPILTFIPCTFGQSACVYNSQAYAFMERPQSYFSQAFSSGSLLFFCFLGIFSIATFNITGVTVTKYINALARSIGDVTRTILVWGVGLIITATAGATHPNYQWELLDGGAIALQLVGFVIVVAGNLIYNEIIKVPFLSGSSKDEQNPLLDNSSDDNNLQVSMQEPKPQEKESQLTSNNELDKQDEK